LILADIYGDHDVTPQFKVEKFKADFLIESRNLLVEFDGFRHYSSTKVVLRDKAFFCAATEQLYDVVRIPYFIQTNVVMPLYFGLDLASQQTATYPHGFVHENCLHPKDFCVAGLKRFIFEVDRLPTPIREDIYETFDSEDSYIFDYFRNSLICDDYNPSWLG
jgi:hypothetical protein